MGLGANLTLTFAMTNDFSPYHPSFQKKTGSDRGGVLHHVEQGLIVLFCDVQK